MNPAGYDPRRMVAELEDRLARAKENAAIVTALSGDGEAADGTVRVSVGPTGALTGVEFEPKAMRLPSVDLAAAVLAAAQAAQRDVMAKVREVYSGGDAGGGVDVAAVAQGEVDISAMIDDKLAAARAKLLDAR